MKKKILYSLMIALVGGASLSCTDMLDEESKVKVTSQYIYGTPEGLDRAVVALYEMDRSLITKGTEGAEVASVLFFDYATDISFSRAGSNSSLGNLSFTPTQGDIGTFWSHNYQLIGKANEVIFYAEKLGFEDNLTKTAWAEAKLIRGRAYFELYKRFERLYLNTEVTMVDNIKRDYKPATRQEVFALIKDDLQAGIDALNWTVTISPKGTPFYGRFTKAVAKHIRAQVAMWENDWDRAITECEDIFGCPDYGMLSSAIESFNDGNLNSKEVLFTYQFSEDKGGGGGTSSGSRTGHRMTLYTTPGYHSMAGLQTSLEYGGYGWGRAYPNYYLLSLYDQANDKRYSQLFRHKWQYNNPKTLPSGKKIGDDVDASKSTNWEAQQHPMTLKYFDTWTNASQPDRRTSFKDIVVYRLAETYLMAAEAYYHRDGGSSTKAIEYYNKTWARAGNVPFTGSLTINTLLDEYARELHMEGIRWGLLKRLGLLERVKLHGGESKSDFPYMSADNYLKVRTNFLPKHYTWPIPQAEVDQMGVGFPQSPLWK